MLHPPLYALDATPQGLAIPADTWSMPTAMVCNTAAFLLEINNEVQNTRRQRLLIRT